MGFLQLCLLFSNDPLPMVANAPVGFFDSLIANFTVGGQILAAGTRALVGIKEDASRLKRALVANSRRNIPNGRPGRRPDYQNFRMDGRSYDSIFALANGWFEVSLQIKQKLFARNHNVYVGRIPIIP